MPKIEQKRTTDLVVKGSSDLAELLNTMSTKQDTQADLVHFINYKGNNGKKNLVPVVQCVEGLRTLLKKR